MSEHHADIEPCIMTPILRIPFPRGKLSALPPSERTTLFLFGYAANQIGMLGKLVLFSTNKTPDDPIEQKLSGAQSQMLARLTIGALAEAWELIRSRFLESSVGREYGPLLDVGGQAALKTLKQHFSNSGLLHKLRNSYAFHYPKSDEVDKAFVVANADAEWDNDWDFILAQSNLNSFFFGCDVVILHGILVATGEISLIEAQQKIMGEVRVVSDAMIAFIHSFFAALWKRRFGDDMPGVICGDINQAPDVDSVWIPFFVKVVPQSAT